MLYLSAPRLLPIVAFIVLPLVLGIYWQRVLLSVCVFALLAISWDILAQSSMVSLGQALFFGMGAYCSGILNHYFGLTPFVSIPIAALVGGRDLHDSPTAGFKAPGRLFRHGYPDHSPHA
jgi:branched-chain amino acid transport system permease protein